MSDAVPTVSVITATYNWSSVLRYSIQSVLGQSFQDFEMLIVGDGCTDDSAEVVASFNDSRLRWHNLPENTGSQALPNNAGLELARGRYVAYLGHDDIWYPTHLELLVGTLDQTDAGLAHTLSVYLGTPDSGVRVLMGLPPTGASEKYHWAPPSSWMHRRTIAHDIGGWKDYRTTELAPDEDFLTRAWADGKGVVDVRELTVFKFPSTWRRNSYIVKPCHEQADYLRRIRTEPDFLSSELLEIAAAYALKKPTWPPDIPEPLATDDRTLGWQVRHFRWLRGLEQEPSPRTTELETLEAFDRAREVLFGPIDYVIHAENNDPQIMLPEFDFRKCGRLLLRIDITSPDVTTLQLFYATQATPYYTEAQSMTRQVSPARTRVFIALAADQIVDALRLDPGCCRGQYTIHSIEVRGDRVDRSPAAKYRHLNFEW